VKGTPGMRNRSTEPVDAIGVPGFTMGKVGRVGAPPGARVRIPSSTDERQTGELRAFSVAFLWQRDYSNQFCLNQFKKHYLLMNI
jgi:hypothetical protein